MKIPTHELEKLRDNYESHYALEVNAYSEAIDDVIQVLSNYTPEKTAIKSGIYELDTLIEMYENNQIDFISLTSRVWNTGYKYGYDEATTQACEEISKNYQPIR